MPSWCAWATPGRSRTAGCRATAATSTASGSSIAGAWPTATPSASATPPCCPATGTLPQATAQAGVFPGPGGLSNAQRAVLRALCRPFADGASWERAATNGEIAAELVLSLEAVKGHLRVLFAKFEVSDLPQNEKRLRLAERALASGAVNLAELRDDRPATR